MTDYTFRHTITAALFVLLALFLVDVQQAHAVGISPSRLEYEYLRPGITVEKRFVLSRSDTRGNIPYSLEIDESLNGWVISGIGDQFTFAEGRERLEFNLLATIPEDAEYGTYTGKIRIKSVADHVDGEQVSVNLGVTLDVALTVQADLFTNWSVKSVNVPTVEETTRPNLEIGIRNDGNDFIWPGAVTADIYNVDSRRLVQKVRITDFTRVPGIAPFSQGKVLATLPDILTAGNYEIFVNVYDKANVLKIEESTNFSILGTNELKKQGRLTNVVFFPHRLVNSSDVLDITATFNNTGTINLPVRLVAEFYEDDNIVLAKSGEVTTIMAGKRDDISVELRPALPEGVYDVRVYAQFDERISTIQTFSYSIGEREYTFVIIGVLALLLILSLAIARMRFSK